MATQYEGRWIPNRPKKRLSNATYAAFDEMVSAMVASAEDPKGMCEVIKGKFGDSNTSTSLSFAKSDLQRAMATLEDDAPRYLAALWDGISYLAEHEDVPEQDYINAILQTNSDSYQLDDDQVLEERGDIVVTQQNLEASPLSAHYQQKEQIGEGGFGVVYRIEKKTDYGTFEFAIKYFDPSAFNISPNGVERFKREVLVLNRLQHRGIVPILEGGIASDRRPYCLMPIIRGANIRDALEGAAVEDIAKQFISVCHSIEFAHANNILHRDLKPGNILVRESDSQTVVVDFGAAFLLDNLDETSLTLANVGSPGYIPQEVVNNPKLRSPQHDVYSLGITLYEVMARCRPDLDAYVQLGEIDLSFAPFDPIVSKAIAPAPSRYKQISSFRQALENISHA